MEAQQPRRSHNVVNGAVRGAFRSVRLGWTDAVTGERLMIETSGDSSFFSALETQGFERLPDGGATPRSRPIGHASARELAPRVHPLRGGAAG